MIAVIHKDGSSFKGLMNYLLHGRKGEENPDRVAWTHTVNLGTEDPRRATAVMIATSKMQDELKRQAEMPTTGRKSDKVVQHITLSWAKGEDVTREEMIAAAQGALSYLGNTEGEKLNKKQAAKRTQRADEHQVVMVSHDDRDHRHVHLCVGKIHPEHGLMLPNNKNYEKLSAWALDYRRSMGLEHLCPKRAANAAKRAQGLLTNHPRIPRNVYEANQEIEAAPEQSRRRAHLEELRRKSKELKAKQETTKAAHAKAWRKLDAEHTAREKQMRTDTAEAIRAKRSGILKTYGGKVDALHEQQAKQVKQFYDARETVAGRARNAWSAIKSRQWMREIRTSPLKATSQAFRLAFDSGMQLAELERYHASEGRQLLADRRREERSAAQHLRGELKDKLDDNRRTYRRAFNDLRFEQAMAKAKLSADWDQLKQDRRAVEDELALEPHADGQREGGRGGGGRRPQPTKIKPQTLQQRVEPPANDAPPSDRQSFREQRRASRRPPERRDNEGPAGGRERE